MTTTSKFIIAEVALSFAAVWFILFLGRREETEERDYVVVEVSDAGLVGVQLTEAIDPCVLTTLSFEAISEVPKGKDCTFTIVVSDTVASPRIMASEGLDVTASYSPSGLMSIHTDLKQSAEVTVYLPTSVERLNNIQIEGNSTVTTVLDGLSRPLMSIMKSEEVKMNNCTFENVVIATGFFQDDSYPMNNLRMTNSSIGHLVSIGSLGVTGGEIGEIVIDESVYISRIRNKCGRVIMLSDDATDCYMYNVESVEPLKNESAYER